MRRKLVSWWVAFLLSVAMCSALAVAALREAAPDGPRLPAKRDPAKVSDVEMELLLNRVREGDLQALQGNMKAARLAWGDARRQGAGLWPIHEGLGDSYVRVKLYDEAIRAYTEAEGLVPEKFAPIRASLRYKRAEVQATRGRTLEAIEDFLELGHPGLFGRVLELIPKEEPEPALELVRRRAKIHDPRVYRLLAVALERFERKAEAAEALAKYAMTVAPWDHQLNVRAVDALRAAKKLDLAVEVCRAWARAEPRGSEAYRLMGEVLLEAGREREAVVAYTSIVDVRPGDAGTHRILGAIFRKLNRLEDALAQYQAALKARPEDQETYVALAGLYEEKGEPEKGEQLIFEAAKRFGMKGELREKMVSTTRKRIEQLETEGKKDEVFKLRRELGRLNVPELGLFDLKVIMTWDAKTDVDMDIHEPGGEHIHHGNTHSKSGGHYYEDNTTAYGPETYTLPEAAPGTYRIGAHLHSGSRSKVKFVVILHEGTPREERREETFVLEKQGDQKFIRDVVIGK